MHILYCDCNPSGIESMARAIENGHYVSFLEQTSHNFYNKNERYQSVVSQISNIFRVDVLTDFQTLYNAVETINSYRKIDAVIAPCEPSLEMISQVCQELGIKFTSPIGVQNARKKDVARNLLEENTLESAKYAKVFSLEDAISSAQKIGYPVVVKPTSGFNSWIAETVHTQAQLESYFENALAQCDSVPEAYKEQFNRGILVEECLIGTLLSVEIGFDINGKRQDIIISGRAQSRENECIELGSLIPGNITQEQEAACYDYAEKVCNALNLDFGIFHIEIMLTDRGPVLVEANPRLMGGVMPTIYEYAIGKPVFDYVFDLYGCKACDNNYPLAQQTVTVRKIIPLEDGKINQDINLDWLHHHDDISIFYNDNIQSCQQVTAGQLLGRILVKGETFDTAKNTADHLLFNIEKQIGFKLHHDI